MTRWTTQDWNLAALAICAIAIGGALVLEYDFDLVPCALCLTQRLFLILGGVIALAGLWHDSSIRIYPVAALGSIAAGAGFSIRQIYLQLNPEAAGACGMELDMLVEYDYPWIDVLRAMTSGTGSCAEPSLVPAAALAGFAIVAICLIQQLRSR